MAGTIGSEIRSAEALGLLDSGSLVGPRLAPKVGITSVTADSREVEQGSLFIALKGENADGIDFVGEAVSRGAVAVLTTPDGALRARSAFGELPVSFILNSDPRGQLARIAARFWGAQPEIAVLVTGTNGKTSCVEFSRKLWDGLGTKSASIGTLGACGSSSQRPLKLTTPDPVTLHEILAEFAHEGISHVALEASSHALAQRRVDAVNVSVAVFTGLTRDHLDYHGDAHAYAAAKLKLFLELLPQDGCAALNSDDQFGLFILSAMKNRGVRCIAVGHGSEARAGFRIRDWAPSPKGQKIHFEYGGQSWSVELPLAGKFQALNALLAAAGVVGAGAEEERVFDALPRLTGVKGRMELVAQCGNGAKIFVDYAHSPNALSAVLDAARCHTGYGGRVHVVFGAGGLRDRGKREQMGAVAARMADRVTVTDDNPRTENPVAIRRAIRRGAPGAREIGDRREAIFTAIAELAGGDTLVIAGKGHETVQERAVGSVGFHDPEVVREAVTATGDAI